MSCDFSTVLTAARLLVNEYERNSQLGILHWEFPTGKSQLGIPSRYFGLGLGLIIIIIIIIIINNNNNNDDDADENNLRELTATSVVMRA